MPMMPAQSRPPPRLRYDERGSASVEQAGLAALIALVLLTAIAAIAAAGDLSGGRDIGRTIARRITCGPHLPDACHHHPLVPAYGWSLARVVRFLAPAPVALPGPSGTPIAPVDFRRCRSSSCAVPRLGAEALHLTTSGRRTTAFTELRDRVPGTSAVQIVYWLYRPSLGWEEMQRTATAEAIAAAAAVPVLVRDDPALVPLETLPGRDHYEFPAGEEPPWRWQIDGRYPGWSS